MSWISTRSAGLALICRACTKHPPVKWKLMHDDDEDFWTALCNPTRGEATAETSPQSGVWESWECPWLSPPSAIPKSPDSPIIHPARNFNVEKRKLTCVFGMVSSRSTVSMWVELLAIRLCLCTRPSPTSPGARQGLSRPLGIAKHRTTTDLEIAVSSGVAGSFGPGSQRKVPRQNPISQCPLVKLGLLGPEQGQEQRFDTAVAMPADEARFLRFMKHVKTGYESELEESSDDESSPRERGQQWAAQKFGEWLVSEVRRHGSVGKICQETGV